jgi:hypothetical protein
VRHVPLTCLTCLHFCAYNITTNCGRVGGRRDGRTTHARQCAARPPLPFWQTIYPPQKASNPRRVGAH